MLLLNSRFVRRAAMFTGRTWWTGKIWAVVGSQWMTRTAFCIRFLKEIQKMRVIFKDLVIWSLLDHWRSMSHFFYFYLPLFSLIFWSKFKLESSKRKPKKFPNYELNLKAELLSKTRIEIQIVFWSINARK